MYYPRFTKVIIHYFLTQDKIISWRNKIGMHTSRDDYLINTLRFVSAKEATQIYGAILPESLTSHEMKETKAYKTYLGFATGATPPKKARKFKKPAFPQLTTVLVSLEEPTGKSKRVKRPVKKSTKAPARGVVIRETPEMTLSKKKDKEVRRKSMRDFHKTHPSGSGTVTKTAPSAAKIKPSVTNEGTGVIPRVSDVTKEESSKSEAKSWGNDEDDNNNKQDSSGEDSDQENDSRRCEDDRDGLYLPVSLYDDVDIRLNEPVDTDKGFIQEEGTDAVMTNVQQGNENPEILQVIEDAHVTLSTVPQKTEDPLHTQVTALADDHLDARLGATRDEFMNHLSASITARITEQVKIQLPQILPKESSYKTAATLTEFVLKKILIDKMDKSESYLAALEHRECYEGLIKLYDLDKTIFSTYDRGLKKRKTSKDASLVTGPKAKESQSGLSKCDKSQSKSSGKSVQSEEPEFEVADLDMPQDQEENPGNDNEEPKEKVASKRD
ncbi:hypothetical protein Tco_1457965 [Tanacetum coccineum]